MVNSDLTQKNEPGGRSRVCAVSYLNTAPLVWGAVHGEEKDQLDLSFAVPSICAERVAEGDADVGLVPVIEAARHGWASVEGIGIACRGAVRSILLISKVPYERIETLAVDSGSRTSVQLARIVLQRRYGRTPRLLRRAPDPVRMLDEADAALLIGDAALRVEPAGLGLRCLDLGAEWVELTGLPMVFALWSGPAGKITPALSATLKASCQAGLAKLDEIIAEEAERRGFSLELVQRYFTENVTYLLGAEEAAGLELYLQYARELGECAVEEMQTMEMPIR